MSGEGIETPQSDSALRSELERCLESGNYLIALVRREQDQLQLRRFTRNFSVADFEPAVELLRRNLREEHDRLIREDEAEQ